jgi:hypothetical protein
MMAVVGRVDTTLQGQISGTLGPFGFSRFGSFTDVETSNGDLYPMFSLRWNQGVNNSVPFGLRPYSGQIAPSTASI